LKLLFLLVIFHFFFPFLLFYYHLYSHILPYTKHRP
jgi:hypothetical protein